MPTKQFSLTNNEPPNLSVTWAGGWKNARIALSESPVLEFETQKDLKDGREAILPDGRTLSVQLVSNLRGSHLRLLVDGAPVPGSGSDPNVQLKSVYGIIFFVAGLSAGLGLVAALWNVTFLQSIGLGWGSVVVGAIYGILGFFTMRKSKVALVLAMLLFTLDTVAMLIPAGPDFSPPIGAIVVRVFFLIGMSQGFNAISQLKAKTALT